MAKNFKKGLSAFLAALMCTSTMSMAVMAEDNPQTNFKGMKLENVVSSGDEYNYMIAQDLVSNPKTTIPLPVMSFICLTTFRQKVKLSPTAHVPTVHIALYAIRKVFPDGEYIRVSMPISFGKM